MSGRLRAGLLSPVIVKFPRVSVARVGAERKGSRLWMSEARGEKLVGAICRSRASPEQPYCWKKSQNSAHEVVISSGMRHHEYPIRRKQH